MIAMTTTDDYYGIEVGLVDKCKALTRTLLNAVNAEASAKATADRKLAEVSESQGVAADQAVFIGRVLNKMKQMIPHGSFGKWLDAEFPYSESTAQRYMKLAKKKDKESVVQPPKPSLKKNVTVLKPAVIAVFKGKEALSGALAEVLEKQRGGENVTEKKALEIANQHLLAKVAASVGDKDDHPSMPVSTAPENRMTAAFEAVDAEVEQVEVAAPVDPEQLTDKQKLAKIMELVASLESPDTQYEVVTQTVALLHEEDRGQLFAKLNATYKQTEVKQTELFAGDPADLIPPKKINTPEVRKAWGRWCDSNKAKGRPLTVDEGNAQLKLLASGKAETAVLRIEHALAMRMESIPLAKELPKDFEHPTEEQVFGYAQAMKIPKTEAVDFYRYYASQGWKKSNGQLVEDWQQSLHSWHTKQVSEKEEKGKPKHSGFDEPETPNPALTVDRTVKPRINLNVGQSMDRRPQRA